jgi:XTP/dITP diphosphohydrolase
MDEIYFATSNKWKFSQAKAYFKQRNIQVEQLDLELPESRSEEVLEIAGEKAKFAYQKFLKPVFVIDAAFHIKALNDFPKTYVKFAERHLGAEGIIKLLERVEDRRWEFLNVLYYKDKSVEKSFTGVIKGVFAEGLAGDKVYKVREFERIQIPEGYDKTFAEMTPEEWQAFDDKIWKPVVFDKFTRWLLKPNL